MRHAPGALRRATSAFATTAASMRGRRFSMKGVFMANPTDGRFAAIDIGTVTCRMLIADVVDGCVVPVAKGYEIVNLGEGVDATGVLKPEAMERVAGAIDRYLEVRASCDTAERPVLSTTVAATSAARDAGNADEFAALLARRGLELAVIPGEKEAALSFRGACADFACADEEPPTILVVDVGGGSTELIAGKAGGEPVRARSFDIGCRRVTERFLSADPLEDEEAARARAWMRERFDEFFACEGLPPIDGMIAVAGTATTVVSIREEMAVYDSDRVHGSWVSLDELRDVNARLSAIPLAERERVVGLDPKRAPVICAGLMILEEVMAAGGFGGFTVSESDILQGLVLEAARLRSRSSFSW